MTENRSNRRRAAQESMGLTSAEEKAMDERSIEKELERQEAKRRKREMIEDSSAYRATQTIAKWMDKFFLDPLLGFLPGGVGDVISQALVLPFIYVSAFQVRSVPLTLAVIYNALVDMVIGLIPFWIGNICDIFKRSYLQNCKLIVGFVEDDKEIIAEVNRKATLTGVLIVVLCVLIYLLVSLVVRLGTWLWDTVGAMF